MARKPEASQATPAQAADLPPPAEGGSYVIENGVRKRVEWTKERADDAPTAPSAPAQKEG